MTHRKLEGREPPGILMVLVISQLRPLTLNLTACRSLHLAQIKSQKCESKPHGLMVPPLCWLFQSSHLLMTHMCALESQPPVQVLVHTSSCFLNRNEDYCSRFYSPSLNIYHAFNFLLQVLDVTWWAGQEGRQGANGARRHCSGLWSHGHRGSFSTSV